MGADSYAAIPKHVRVWFSIISRLLLIAFAAAFTFWLIHEFTSQYNNFQKQIGKTLVDGYLMDIANPADPQSNMSLSINIYSRYVAAESGVNAYVTLYPNLNYTTDSNLPKHYYLFFDGSNCDSGLPKYGRLHPCFVELANSNNYANYTGLAHMVFPHMGEYQVRLSLDKTDELNKKGTVGDQKIVVDSSSVPNDIVNFRLSTNIALLSTGMAGALTLIGVIISSFFFERR